MKGTNCEKNDFAVITLGGSRLFDLEEDGSDHDFEAILTGETATKLSDERFSKIQIDGNDYFCIPLSAMLELGACASPLVVPTYDKVCGGSNQTLMDFWTSNAVGLADIYPLATYRRALAQVESYLTTPGLERTYRIAVRLLGMMWCRYYTGDLLSARQLTDTWRARYFAAKRGELSAADILVWYEQLNTPSIRRYFESEPVNRTLHDEYKGLINTILEG